MTEATQATQAAPAAQTPAAGAETAAVAQQAAQGQTMGDIATAAQQSGSAQATTSLMGEPSTGNPDFRKMLGEYAEHPSLKDLGDDPQKLAKSYIETKSMVGRKLEDVFGKTDDPEARKVLQDHYRKTFVPEKAEDYGLEKPALPEGIDQQVFDNLYSEDRQKGFLTKAHEIGLTKEQVAELSQWDLETNVASLKANMKTPEERANTFKQELAKRHPDVDSGKMLETAGNLFSKVLGKEQLEAFSQTNDPQVLRLMMAEALFNFQNQYLSEDSAPGNMQQSSGKTVAELNAEAQTLMNDPAYFNPTVNPAKNEQLKKQVRSIYQQMEKMKG